MSGSGARGVLWEEHSLLGASFVESPAGGPLGVGAYAAEEPPSHAREGAFLADLTGLAYQLVQGRDAPGLVSCAFAGELPGVGEARFGACLTGEGGLVSVPLVLRTGDTEHVVLDVSPRGGSLVAWLGFLAGIRQGDTAPFARARLEDASAMLVPLLVCGAAAGRVLSDYVRGPGALPAAGRVCQSRLDAISALVARVPLPDGTGPCYLALVPPARARVLWRSLLSFPEVAPMGHGTLRVLAARALPWSGLSAGADVARPSRSELRGMGLVRASDDFVGARSLPLEGDGGATATEGDSR